MHSLVYVIAESCWILHALDLVDFEGQNLHWQRQFSLVC